MNDTLVNSKVLNSGSCLCGQISFTVSEFLPSVGHCHCSMCRKFHGAAFSTFAEVKVENLVFTRGESLLQSYQADNGTVRKFCKCCGSSLIFESQYNRQDKTTEIALATFDQLAPISPQAHIFTESQVPWLEIHDQLTKFKRYRE